MSSGEIVVWATHFELHAPYICNIFHAIKAALDSEMQVRRLKSDAACPIHFVEPQYTARCFLILPSLSCCVLNFGTELLTPTRQALQTEAKQRRW